MKLTVIAFAVALVTLAAPLAQAATTPAAATPSNTGSTDNPPAVWNLKPFYADDAAWDASRQKLLALTATP